MCVDDERARRAQVRAKTRTRRAARNKPHTARGGRGRRARKHKSNIRGARGGSRVKRMRQQSANQFPGPVFKKRAQGVRVGERRADAAARSGQKER